MSEKHKRRQEGERESTRVAYLVSQLRHRQRVADRRQLRAQLIALGLARQQGRCACLRRSRERQGLPLQPLFRALLFPPRHSRSVLLSALRRCSLLNRRNLRKFRRRPGHRGVRVRAQRGVAFRAMLR